MFCGRLGVIPGGSAVCDSRWSCISQRITSPTYGVSFVIFLSDSVSFCFLTLNVFFFTSSAPFSCSSFSVLFIISSHVFPLSFPSLSASTVYFFLFSFLWFLTGFKTSLENSMNLDLCVSPFRGLCSLRIFFCSLYNWIGTASCLLFCGLESQLRTVDPLICSFSHLCS